jgi:GntR family transcriptional regulator
MYIPIDPASGVPIYLQIINGMKYAIAMGSLKPGDQIPSVREISAQLRINPNTVLKAIKELEHENIIFIKRGMGAYVANADSSITEREREEIISEMLKKAVTQAIHFKVSPQRLKQIFDRETKKFDKPEK